MNKFTVCLALTLCGAAVPLAAQYATKPPASRSERQGFWIGFGFGTGHLSFGGDVSSAQAEDALSGHLRLGGTLNQKWRLGAETNGWTKHVGGADVQFGALMGTATFYPEAQGNFFLKGGLGFGRYVEDYGTDDFTIDGGAVTLGAGYDFRFSGNVGVSLVGNYVTTGNAPVKFDGSDTGYNGSVHLLQVGVGVIWH